MMNEYERGRRMPAGQSHGKNGTRSSKARSSSSSYRTGNSPHRSGSFSERGSGGARRSSHPQNRSARGRNNSRYKRKNPYGYGGLPGGLWPVLVGLVVVVAAVSLVFGMKGRNSVTEPETTMEETTVPPTELKKEVKVDGINITGMSIDAARGAILKQYPWAMKVTYGGEVYEVANLMEHQIDQLLSQIYSGGEPKESYTLDTKGLEEVISVQAAAIAQKWNKAAKNGSISAFDQAANKFTFSGGEKGLEVDEEKLAADIQKALDKKQFDAVIEASVKEIEPEFNEAAAREKYTTISTFTTNTTANSKRNTNVKLASQAINGTVLMPGEEFSFNEVVGERTEEKGYQAAAAYNNGEVVQEIGGGVCQVSTTLYNAVLRAGLKTTVRRSHTYEPSYVTPGQDATVSYGGPDYKFVNNSTTAIGIRASYGDQVCTVSIYGIPILEEGVKYALRSKKIKDTDLPAPTYEEDPTLLPDVEKVKSQGSQGSYWETRLEISKDGEIISNEVDHNTTYKGHAPVILRNTSGVVISPEETTAPESTVVPSEGAADGLVSTASPGTEGNAGTESRPAESRTSESRPAETTRGQAPAEPQTTAPSGNNVNPGGPGFVSPGSGGAGQAPADSQAPLPAGPGSQDAPVVVPNPLS